MKIDIYFWKVHKKWICVGAMKLTNTRMQLFETLATFSGSLLSHKTNSSSLRALMRSSTSYSFIAPAPSHLIAFFAHIFISYYSTTRTIMPVIIVVFFKICLFHISVLKNPQKYSAWSFGQRTMNNFSFLLNHEDKQKNISSRR